MLLDKEGFIIDIDGVVGKSKTPIAEGVEAVKRLKKIGKKIIFVSNNSTRSRRILFDRLKFTISENIIVQTNFKIWGFPILHLGNRNDFESPILKKLYYLSFVLVIIIPYQ